MQQNAKEREAAREMQLGEFGERRADRALDRARLAEAARANEDIRRMGVVGQGEAAKERSAAQLLNFIQSPGLPAAYGIDEAKDPKRAAEFRRQLYNEYANRVGITQPTAPVDTTNVALRGAAEKAGLVKPTGAPTATPTPAPVVAPTQAAAQAATQPATQPGAAPGGAGEFTRTGPGGGVYGPGTLGSPLGVEYAGPMNVRTGMPGSAVSGPWTIRAITPDTHTPLPPDAYARAFGFNTQEELSRGMETAMMTAALQEPISPGAHSVEALQSIGGAGAQQALGALMRSRPGEMVSFPEVYGPKGAHIGGPTGTAEATSPLPVGMTGPSTYNPLPYEVFQPAAFTKPPGTPGRENVIGRAIAKVGDPALDPRYGATLAGLSPQERARYQQQAAASTFREVPATATDRGHIFMNEPNAIPTLPAMTVTPTETRPSSVAGGGTNAFAGVTATGEPRPSAAGQPLGLLQRPAPPGTPETAPPSSAFGTKPGLFHFGANAPYSPTDLGKPNAWTVPEYMRGPSAGVPQLPANQPQFAPSNLVPSPAAPGSAAQQPPPMPLQRPYYYPGT
jgi:hypothetical protein